MSDQVEAVLQFAAKHDLCLDREGARLFVENRAALAKNPTDAEAQRIAKHFESVFYWAKAELTFADFLAAPECEHGCPECRAHDARYAARIIARSAAASGS